MTSLGPFHWCVFSLRGSLGPTLCSCIDAPDACQGDVAGNKHAECRFETNILRRCIRQNDDICHVCVLNTKTHVYISEICIFRIWKPKMVLDALDFFTFVASGFCFDQACKVRAMFEWCYSSATILHRECWVSRSLITCWSLLDRSNIKNEALIFQGTASFILLSLHFTNQLQ